MPFHRVDEFMFIRSGIKIEHRIEPVDPELVPDHLAVGGTGSRIADGPVIIDALHSWNRGSDNTFSGNICRNYPDREDIPDDPGGE